MSRRDRLLAFVATLSLIGLLAIVAAVMRQFGAGPAADALAGAVRDLIVVAAAMRPSQTQQDPPA